MNKKYKVSILVALVCLLICLVRANVVWAADAIVTFGDTEFVKKPGETIEVSVIISGQDNIGTYHAEIKYDAEAIKYIGGAESVDGSTVVLEGTGYGNLINYKLRFETVGVKETGLYVAGAQINSNENASMNLSAITYIPVHIVNDESDVDGANIAYSVPVVGQAQAISGESYYIVDLDKYVPDDADWSYEKVKGNYNNTPMTFLTDAERTVRFLYLVDSDLKYHMYAYDNIKGQLYPCYVQMDGSRKYYYMSCNTVENWPSSLSLSIINSRNIVYAMDTAGYCAYYEFNGNYFTPWENSSGEDYDSQQSIKIIMIIAIATIAMIIVLRLAFISTAQRRRRRKRKKKREQLSNASNKKNKILKSNGRPVKRAKEESHEDKEDEDEYIEFIDMLEDVTGDEEILHEKADPRTPIIAVKNVSMKFRISTSSASGIKEFFIQKVKKQVKYRTLLALRNISFNIYKGEVVGIIGSNGSGKSTLLRIISGALTPTEGTVEVDNRKVQLLTLGAGFDMELTARENVYLNGAIIGYSKEFIDENYDKIVEFAELENFMDEKVKNFSSGMVSRLGFSIATAGITPEILILDEILSVGDEAFRSKSLNRVREMIHSGATVIMVSHSLGTIMENCTKAVWLEKGKFMAIGETKKVCDAYKKSIEANYTGLMCKDHVWYYMKNGTPDYRFVGLAQNQYGFWYVKNGMIDFKYTGLVRNVHGRWYVKDGKADFSYNGEYDDNGVIVMIENGRVVSEDV